MKRKLLFILIPAAIVLMAATTHDYFLLPENFFIHKGDKLNLHLIGGETFVKQDEIGFQAKKTDKFMLYQGSKKYDLAPVAKDGAAPVISYEVANSGQALVEMTRVVDFADASRDSYAEFLANQALDKLSEKVKASNQFRVREKYTRYMKTLFSVDDHDGDAYKKELKEDYEIILKDDPYSKKYGDDMTAVIKFKGKPAEGAQATLYIKSITGNVYNTSLVANKKGEVFFTMTREGIFLLRSVRVEPTKDKDADYESWWASYTFPFSSSDEVPNTYKEFGFGDKH